MFDDAGRYRAGSATTRYQAPDAPAPVPSAPEALAVRTDDAARTATVTWSAPATNAGSVTGYDVLLDGVAVTRASGTAMTQVLSDLEYDRPYVVTVVALPANGDSSAASASFRLVSPDAGTPSVPQSVVATAGHQSATVTWAAPASSPGSAVTRYDVEALDAAGVRVGAVVPVSATALLTARVGGLANGQPYTIRVTAENTAGKTASAVSNAVTPNDVLTIVTAEFRTGRNEWRVDGASRAPGSTITLTARVGGRTFQLAQVAVQADGSWSFQERDTATARRAAAGATVTASSGGTASPSTGAEPVTRAVTIRR